MRHAASIICSCVLQPVRIAAPPQAPFREQAAARASLWMPTDTRISMCCGRSTTTPFTRSRYERSSVCGARAAEPSDS